REDAALHVKSARAARPARPVRSDADPPHWGGKAPSVLPGCRAPGYCGLPSTPTAYNVTHPVSCAPRYAPTAHNVGPTTEAEASRPSVFAFPVLRIRWAHVSVARGFAAS